MLTSVVSINAFAQTNGSPLWLRYPAISPNGAEIAFSYKGDIYKVPTTGGNATILTTNSAYDYMPVWSPDGLTIAFASNRNGNFDIFTMPSNGGEPVRLTFHSTNEYPSAFTVNGSEILFKASMQDNANNVLFPSDILTELYSVPVAGGRVKQVFTTPAENAVFSPNGQLIAYHDCKGYEDNWRKHHQSSVTRDIWVYDTQSQTHKKISSFAGEDRNPVFAADGNTLYYLSEINGSFNVTAQDVALTSQPKSLTSFTKHPVRFLTLSANGIFCYHYNGEIYTQPLNGTPKKVSIAIATDKTEQEITYESLSKGATEMAVSPDGKEVAFIIRGDVFVTSTNHNNTKRITNTPEQERSVSFSPDGKKLLYASERNGSWNIYQTSVASAEEPNFTLSTILKEEPVVTIPEETFQPAYSPDGKEVAFLKERTTLCVINLESKKIRTILDGRYNYSYSDGDQWYQWSPDGRWFVANFMEAPSWPDTDVALVKADGSGEFFNLTKSGYDDNTPKWMMNGKAILWFNDKMGMRSHGSWGAQFDAYAMFLTQEALEEFKLSKIEWELLKEKRKKEKEKDKSESKDDTKSNKDSKKGKKEPEKDKGIEPLKIDVNNIDDRKVKLTINSSALSDALLVPDGDKLYYLSRFEKGYDLWVTNLKENETKLLVKINGYAGNLSIDKDQKFLFLLSNGTPMKVEISNNKLTPIKFNAEFSINYPQERDYMYEHMWRQVEKKFYDPNLHGIDWASYKSEYAKFLPHINNNFDYAEMMSELLGELNGSHTGCRFRSNPKNADQTASLGVFYDYTHLGNGMKIAEVLDKSPLNNSKGKVKPGVIIEKIDGVEITANSSYYNLLNRKADKLTLIEFYNPTSGERWTESVKPISRWDESDLLYKQWVKKRADDVDRLSNGRIGYVHVSGMNSQSYREVYSELLGKYRSKEAVIVDTRFNGGGWLHDDLATLLNGKKYADFSPRGQHIGAEPIAKWHKPSVVLVGEGNYSDAHGFPFVYKTLGIGKLIGMPVPGTMTAVWWESQVDPSLVFGIPQMGVKDKNGKYLENQQLYPDIQVSIKPEEAATGTDTQIKAAVEELLKQLK